METQLHEIDPEGDIIISLGRSNSAFATWHEEQDHPPSILSQPLPDIVDEPEAELEDELEDEFESDSEEPEPANLDLPAENDPISERGPTSDQTDPVGKEPSDDDWASTANVKIRVSSRHLILASPQAKRMLDAAWIEHNTLKSQGLLVMEERDWDEEALLVLMNILHGKTRSVPKIISLEMFAKVAVLVDYYECYEAVEIYSDMWMAHLRNKLPQIYCRDLVLWICISWVFRQPEEFGQVTTFALKYSKGPIQTMELPIPERIVRDIDERRQKGIGNVITALRVLLHRMRKGPDSCSFECSSILLGALTKELDARNLLSPRPVPPFSGFSFEPTAESLSAIRSPCWYTRGQSYHQNIHRCTLNQHIDPIINSLNQHAGLTLEDYF